MRDAVISRPDGLCAGPQSFTDTAWREGILAPTMSLTLMAKAMGLRGACRRTGVRGTAFAGTTRPSRGFTLLELLVVLTLAAVLLATIPPLLSKGLSNAELRGAARQLAASLRFARSQAITKGEEAVLVLDVEQRRYRVQGMRREFHLPRELSVKIVTAESEVSGSDTGTIRFFPNGSSTGGRVTVANEKRKVDVDVDWLTGRIALLD